MAQAHSRTTVVTGLLGALGAVLAAQLAFAEIRAVIAEGYGTVIGGDLAQARDEAIVDARVRALEQVAGVFVDAATLIENELLLDAVVRDTTQGLLTSYRVLQEGPVGDGRYRVQIEARVAPDDVRQRLQGLTSDAALVLMVPEANVGRPNDPPIVQQLLAARLLDTGYRVADPAQVARVRERDRQRAHADNDLDAVRGITGRFLAGYLVVGHALSEPSQVIDGIVSARARVSLRVIEAESGRTIVSRDLGEVRGFDLSPERAGQKALRAAGAAAADDLIEQLDRHFRRKERTLEVKILGLKGLDELERFRILLQSLRWVSDVQPQRFDATEAVVTVRYPEKTLYLAGRIGREPGYRVLEFDRTRLVVQARARGRP
jgi:hypothetical protein